MLTVIYQLIVLFFIILVVWDLWREKKWTLQVVASIVLIPLVLRFLMLK
ncbi:hypothetical protein KJ966_08220 [bacterium]|nr:hypothetical protein [bacterium]